MVELSYRNCLLSSLKHTLACFAFIVSFNVFGQSAQEADDSKFDFIPASPNATALGEYGSHPVDLSNGAVNVNIPIYNFQTKNITVPISMSYRTTGLKVDDVESWLGLGWVLNAGGVVKRTIMDVADEANIRKPIPYPQNTAMDDFEMLKFIERDIVSQRFDTQQDEFSFNFMGNSGKFVFDRTGKAIISPKSRMQVERSLDQLGHGEIIITTSDGVKYYFGGDNVEVTNMTNAGGSGCARSFDLHRVTAWYLSKIEHPSGTKVYFDYAKSGYSSYDYGIQRSESRLYASYNPCPDACENFREVKCRTLFEIQQGVRLSRIHSDNGSVEFKFGSNNMIQQIHVFDDKFQLRKRYTTEYKSVVPSTFLNEYSSGLPRYFLKIFAELDSKNLDTISTYKLNYIDVENVPPRLSYAQDHWGYFNGANNTDFLPISDHYLFDDDYTNDPPGNYGGVNAVADREPNFEYAKIGALESITYPTGGKTSFEYESHTKYGTIQQSTESSVGVSAIDTQVVLSSPFTVALLGEVDVYMNLTMESGGTLIKPCTFRIIDDATNNIIYSNNLSLDPGETEITQMVPVSLVEGNYQIEVDLEGVDVNAEMSFTYISEVLDSDENSQIGGVRIARMIDNSLGGESEPIVKEYDYNHFGTLQSSAIPMGDPYYITKKKEESSCALADGNGASYGVVVKTCEYMTLSSSSATKLYNSGGSHIAYSNVTIRYGENGEGGKEEVAYKVFGDASSRLVLGERLHSAPYSDLGWGNGLEEERRVYKKTSGGFQLVRETINEYDYDPLGFEEVKNLLIRKKYQPAINNVYYYECNSFNIGFEVKGERCVATHDHEYWLGLKPFCIAPGADVREYSYYKHPCFGKEVEEIVETYWYFDHLDIMEYSRASHWFYKERMIETQYDDDGDSQVITHDYFYDNPEHLQMTKYTVTDSKGREVTEHYYYPEDFDESLGNNLIELKNRNIVVPIKTERLVDGQQVGGTIFKYNEIGQPLEQYTYRTEVPGPNPIHSSSEYLPAMYELIQSWNYNDDNNLLEHQLTDNMSTTFIWGYTGNYPVARIDNATYAEVDALDLEWELNDYGSLSTNDLNTIRTQLPDAMITTYTFDVLDGVTTITSPNGQVATFRYENGRFVEQSDHNEHVLKRIEYNFSSSN